MNPLKEKRQQLKLTREEISKRLNVSIYTVNEWECGRKIPKGCMLLDIKFAYEMTNIELIEYLETLKQKRNDVNE